jgi:hypothetical protein
MNGSNQSLDEGMGTRERWTRSGAIALGRSRQEISDSRVCPKTAPYQIDVITGAR